MKVTRTPLERIFRAFDINGDFISAEPYGTGHINDTYALTVDQAGQRVRYIFQRLNTNIFKDPRSLMGNVQRVTEHILGKLLAAGAHDVSRRVLTLVPTRDGGCYLDDPDLGFWRAYLFIERARTFDLLETERQAYQAARSFGTFQGLLADYGGPRLSETIPFFHHTRHRFETFQQAVASDPVGRAAEVEQDIAFAFGREALVDCLLDLQAAGEIPERITHNDTKLNNVMLDDVTGEGVCVLDLDTVMPGLSLYDFGDLVRSGCNPVAEDEQDVSKVVARGDIFEALAAGYLEGTGGALLPVEREHLAVAGQLLTFECGLRFLTDHLQGDTYFRIHRPGQNLDRCRTQFALVASLETQANAFMNRIRAL
jgi:hypothetical protein